MSNCTNPKLHNYLQLKCPCYNPKYQQGFGPKLSDRPQVSDTHGLPQITDPFMKSDMAKTTQEANIVIPDFIPDWEGWSRLVWASQKFYGAKVGNFDVKIQYGDNLSGIAISSGFKKRIQHIVTKTTGLVLNLSSDLNKNNNSSFIEFHITPPANQVQFAMMSMCLNAGRLDAAKIFVNEQPLQIGDFYCGESVRFAGNTFMASKFVADDVGEADTVVKFKRDTGITTVKIEIYNLAKNPSGGRLALTDLLIK
jgi:hypothetical protein